MIFRFLLVFESEFNGTLSVGGYYSAVDRLNIDLKFTLNVLP